MRLGSYGVCFLIGLFALPLSGAGLTFFAAAKKVSKESSFQPPVLPNPHSRKNGLALESKCRPHGRTGLGSRTHCGNSQYTGQVQQSYIRPRATRSDVGCTAQGIKASRERKHKMAFVNLTSERSEDGAKRSAYHSEEVRVVTVGPRAKPGSAVRATLTLQRQSQPNASGGLVSFGG